MEEEIISREPLVRVTTGLGRLAPCEHLPQHVFRADGAVAGRPRRDHRRAAESLPGRPAGTGPDPGDR